MTKFKRNSILLVFFINSILLQSCYKMPEYKGIKSFSIDSIKEQNIYINAILLINNPNNFKIKTLNIDYSISTNEVVFAGGKIDKGFELNESQVSLIPTNIIINSDSLLSALKDTDLERDSFELEIEYIIFFNKKNMKVNVKDKIKLSKKEILDNLMKNINPEKIFSIEAVELKSFTPFATSVTIKANFKNEYPIEFTLKSLDLEILNNSSLQEQLGTAKITKSVIIEAYTEKEIELDANLNNVNTGSSVFTGFGTLKLIIKGKSELEINDYELQIPVEFPYELSLFKRN